MGFFLSFFSLFAASRRVLVPHTQLLFIANSLASSFVDKYRAEIYRINVSRNEETARESSIARDPSRVTGYHRFPSDYCYRIFDSLLFSWIGKIKYLWTILAKDFSFSFSFRTQSNKWFVYFGKFKFQVCVFLSSRKRDLSRKINLNIFNVEEDVKVRYILEFNYTVCIYMYIWICQWVFSMDQKNVGHRSRLIKNEIEIIVKSYVKLQES